MYQLQTMIIVTVTITTNKSVTLLAKKKKKTNIYTGRGGSNRILMMFPKFHFLSKQ